MREKHNLLSQLTANSLFAFRALKTKLFTVLNLISLKKFERRILPTSQKEESKSYLFVCCWSAAAALVVLELAGADFCCFILDLDLVEISYLSNYSPYGELLLRSTSE